MMKKIVIATDSFKNSATAQEVCAAIETGLQKAMVNDDLEIIKIPISDGGEGTLSILAEHLGGTLKEESVVGPLGHKVRARYAKLKEDSAIIEMAESSGLELLSSGERDPFRTTTYGVGELILAALDAGARKIYVGIGGSATNDGGAGMAQALGISLQDHSGREIGYGAGSLEHLARIDLSNLDKRIQDTEFIVLSDVNNPLTGPQGASWIYGGQKSAVGQDLATLDSLLEHYGQLVSATIGRNFMEEEGAGAAGGLGFALMAFCGAQVFSGSEVILELLGLEKEILGADLVITGEGKMDTQTNKGKAPYGVVQIAKKHRIPVIAIVGSVVSYDKVYLSGIDLVLDIINRPMSLDEAMEKVIPLLEDAAANVGRALLLGEKYYSKKNAQLNQSMSMGSCREERKNHVE